MIYFRVRTDSDVQADTDADLRNSFKRGDIVDFVDVAPENVARDFPKHVWVAVDVTRSQVIDKLDEWQYLLDYEIVATSLALDGARIRVFTELPGLAGTYGITRSKVEGWINGWGGTVVSEAVNEVRFDITVEDIYKSASFWGQLPADLGIIITEIDYNQTTGVHTATVDVTDATIPLKTIRNKLESADGVTITNLAVPVATIEVERQAIRAYFMEVLKNAVFRVIVLRRWQFSEAVVSAAESANGYVEITPSQALNQLIDKATT